MNFKTRLNKKQHKPLAPIITGMISHKFSYEEIRNALNLPFESLEQYAMFVSDVYFTEMGVLDNLTFNLQYEKIDTKLKKLLLEKLTYPLFLFVLSFMLTLFFNQKFAPSILYMLKDYQIEKLSLNIIYGFSSLLKFLWILVLIIFVVISLLLSQKDFRYLVYIRFHNFKFMKTVRNILTLRFSLVYVFLLKRKYTTQDFFKQIKKSTGIEDVKWLGYLVYEKITQGEPITEALDHAFFNPYFILYFKKGFYNQDISKSLDEYIDILEMMITQEISQIVTLFKACIYTYIFIFIGIYYVFLFQPLSIMEVFI